MGKLRLRIGCTGTLNLALELMTSLIYSANIYFLVVLGFELRVYTVSHSTHSFYDGFCSSQGHANNLPGLALRTAIILFSGSKSN
jgi:hypothetical protein